MKYLYLLVVFLSNMARANSYNLVDYGGYTLDQNSGLENKHERIDFGKPTGRELL